MLTPVGDPLRRRAVVRGAVAPPGRDRRAGPAARPAHRAHRHRRQRRCPGRGPGHGALARLRWPPGSRATPSRRPSSRRRRRSSSRRRWTATCGRTRRPRPTCAGCATTSATPSSSRSPGRSPPGSRGSGAWPSCRPSSMPSWRPSATGRSGPPDPAAGRRSSRRSATPTSTGRHVVVSAGGTREAIDPVRFIGNRSTGRMGMAVVARPPSTAARGSRSWRPTSRCRVPADGATVIRVESTAELRTALHRLVARSGRPAPGSMRWSWPRRSPTSGPSDAADRKLDRGAGLTLELEPTPDVLAQIARLVHGTDRTGDDDATGRSSPRPVLVGFAAETGSLDRAAGQAPTQGRRPARRQRCRRARLGVRHRHQPRQHPRGGRRRATTCRCCPSARSPMPSSTAWPPRWTPATPPRRLER